LKPLGTRELMLTDVPGTGEPFDCLQQRDATLQTCLFPDPESKLDADRTDQQIAAAAGIEFFDVNPWFCYQDQCPTVIGNRVVYANVGHISITYARHLAPLLDKQLHLQAVH